jgi:hypothetical protein
MADARTTYLVAALDQLRQAIRTKNTATAVAILQGVEARYPADARMFIDRLIAAGMRRAGRN